jgi:type IV pilus assembly protein PilM
VKIHNPFAKKTPSCGLDLGSGWAKVVRLSTAAKVPALDCVGRMVWLPSDWDKPEKTAQKLSEFWGSLGLRDKVVISSMAGHAVIIKRATFSFGSEKELAEIINRDFKQYIPYDMKDVYYDYQVMGSGKKEKTYEVTLVASKRTMVHDLEDVLSRCGLGLSIIDVDAFALSNCFEHSYPEYAGEANYLIDIGSQQSVFCVHLKGQPVFFREVSFGGQQITNAIAKSLDVSKADAEKIKFNGPEGLTGAQQERIVQELRSCYSDWALELQRLIGYYQSMVPDAEPAKRLFLAGGGSMIKGLTQSFHNSMGIEVLHLDPWKNVQLDQNRFDRDYLKEVGPQFVVPMGLALRSIRQ